MYQGSILVSLVLLFFIFTNDLPDDLKSNYMIFSAATSLFSVMIDSLRSSNLFNIDYGLIKNWAFQWKMLFSPGPSKQVIGSLFSKKTTHTPQPILTFNKNIIWSRDSHKHVGMVLDKRHAFGNHLKEQIFRIISSKGIELITGLYSFFPRKTLLNIYKSLYTTTSRLYRYNLWWL